MKKLSKIFLAVILLFSLTACSNKSYKEISLIEFKEKMANKDSFVLFIGRVNCSHCVDYKKTINKIISKYNIDIYYIDVDPEKMSEAEINEFNSLTNYGGSTPTTIFINNGIEDNVYNRIVGALPYNTIVNKLKDQGYIK